MIRILILIVLVWLLYQIIRRVIANIKAQMPELPKEKMQRFIDSYKLSDYDASVLVQDKNITEFFEACVGALNDPKKICNWAYVASGEPFGKAGAYAIQSDAARWIERIEGSYSGIMGLPLYETALLLRDRGRGA